MTSIAHWNSKKDVPRSALLTLMLIIFASGTSLADQDDLARRPAEGPYVSLAGGAWTIDLVGVSDGGPRPHGHAGGEAEVGWLWGGMWATSASFRWGGSWFDFDAFASQPLGHVREETWMIRAIVDRRFPGTSGRSTWFGVGFVYGEGHTDINTITLAPDPPPAFFSGGLVRAGAGFPLGGLFELYGELDESVFLGRGGNPEFQETYRWLGRSFAGHLGVRVVQRRGDRD